MARQVTITDYPSPSLISNIINNVAHLFAPLLAGKIETRHDSTSAASIVVPSSPPSPPLSTTTQERVRELPPIPLKLDRVTAPPTIRPHAWGDVSTPFALAHKGHYTRVLAADCLWMPWQHDNLIKSILWFLKPDEAASVDAADATSPPPLPPSVPRALVCAGFSTLR